MRYYSYEIIRPFNAADNPINTYMLEILEHWADKNHLYIYTVQIYELSVHMRTSMGRNVVMRITDGHTSNNTDYRKYCYMVEIIDGKCKRIKKSDW